MPAGGLTVGEIAVELEARTREFTRRMDDADKRMLRFERGADRSTKAAGLSFRNLLGPIAAVGAALAALQVTRKFFSIADAAVQNAAAFESYEIRLKALLGSQQGANRALESFLTLSSRTPFGLSQIVGGAATLASVAGGSRRELEDLTQVTANLAAVTGLKFQEAAGNLQRALSAGIGAADLFRDRGVRRLIEEVNRVPDLTKVSLDELRDLFKRTFEPGALSGFGDAAQQLSLTLGGALSNISDASERFRIALGRALSPAIIATARGVIIPFFDGLTGQIEDNETALQRFFIEGFAKGAEIVARVVEYLGPMAQGFSRALDRVEDLAAGARKAFETISLVIKALGTGFQILGTGLQTAGAALRGISYLLGLRTAEEVEEQFLAAYNSAEASRTAVDDLSKAIENFGKDAPDEVEKTTGAFDELAKKIREGGKAIREIGEEQIRLQRGRAGATDEAATEALRERLKTLAMLEEIDREFEEIDREWSQLEIELALDEQAKEATKAETESMLREAFSGVFSDVLSGEGLNFAETFADLVGTKFQESTEEALLDFGASLVDVLEDAFSNVGDLLGGTGIGQFFSGLGGGAGGLDLGAAFSAAAGLGSRLVSGALQGTSANVRNDLVQSVVTSSQAVRGVVAGPSSIPIAEVGNAIRDAMGGQLIELRRGNTLLASILDAIRSLEIGSFNTSEDLAAAIAAEFNGSVALG